MKQTHLCFTFINLMHKDSIMFIHNAIDSSLNSFCSSSKKEEQKELKNVIAAGEAASKAAKEAVSKEDRAAAVDEMFIKAMEFRKLLGR